MTKKVLASQGTMQECPNATGKLTERVFDLVFGATISIDDTEFDSPG